MARTRAGSGAESDEIIGAVYDAALEPGRWPEALRRVGGTIGAQSSFFFSTHSDVEPGAVLHVFNQPDEMLDGFTSFWHTQDEWMLAAQRKGHVRRGTLVLGGELVPRREFHRTAFYNDFTRRHDIDSMVGSVLFDGTETEPMPFTNLVWYRGPGKPEFEVAERERLRGYLPHFQRAMRIQRRIGWLADRQAQDAFSAMHVASIVLDRHGAVHHHNDAGALLLDSLSPQSYRFGRLRTLGDRSSLAIEDAVATASRGEPARFTALLAGRRPRVMAATLIRIAAGASESFGPATPASDRFLLLVEVPRINGRGVAEAVCTLFHLSRAEVRVLGALLDGDTPAQIASAGGNSVATVRTQISSLLAKTGTASQTELLVMLRGLRV